MKMMNQIKKYAPKGSLKKYAQYATGGGLIAAAVSAQAAVPADVTQALTESKTDVTTVGGLVLSVIVVIFSFMLFRRVLK